MRVTLHFDLDEDVNPAIFAAKVGLACSSGALRPGESVSTEDGVRFVVQESPYGDVDWPPVVRGDEM